MCKNFAKLRFDVTIHVFIDFKQGSTYFFMNNKYSLSSEMLGISIVVDFSNCICGASIIKIFSYFYYFL